MTRKHFNRIAEELADMRKYKTNTPAEKQLVDDMAEKLAGICYSANHNFDTARFLQAAGHGSYNAEMVEVEPTTKGLAALQALGIVELEQSLLAPRAA